MPSDVSLPAYVALEACPWAASVSVVGLSVYCSNVHWSRARQVIDYWLIGCRCVMGNDLLMDPWMIPVHTVAC